MLQKNIYGGIHYYLLVRKDASATRFIVDILSPLYMQEYMTSGKHQVLVLTEEEASDASDWYHGYERCSVEEILWIGIVMRTDLSLLVHSADRQRGGDTRKPGVAAMAKRETDKKVTTGTKRGRRQVFDVGAIVDHIIKLFQDNPCERLPFARELSKRFNIARSVIDRHYPRIVDAL